MIIFGIIFCGDLCQVNLLWLIHATGSNRDEHVHGTSTRYPDCAWELQILCFEIRKEQQRSKASRSCLELLVDKFMSIGFTPSLIDDCVFFRDDIFFMVYVDDGVFLGNDDSKLQDAIKKIQDLGLNNESRNYEMVLMNSPNTPY